MAVVEAAVSDRELRVAGPAEAVESGLERFAVLLDHWIAHLEYRGGSLFFHPGPAAGPVRDHLTAATSDWRRRLREELRLAVRLGQLARSADPEAMAFELHAVVQHASWLHGLLGDPTAYPAARRSVLDQLRRESTALGSRALDRALAAAAGTLD
jgi:hypothetical protein